MKVFFEFSSDKFLLQGPDWLMHIPVWGKVPHGPYLVDGELEDDRGNKSQCKFPFILDASGLRSDPASVE